MGAREYWERMLVYFGIAEEVDPAEEQRAARRTRRDASPVEEWEDEAPAPRPAPARPAPRRSPGTGRINQHAAGVGVVSPRTFNDAQTIADQIKRGVPVIVNLQATDSDLAKRLIDFASGLTYGLDGGMQRIADKVFLLTPPDVDVSAEDRAAMVESGFFNQS
jgi:cell division inhibitor SepF